MSEVAIPDNTPAYKYRGSIPDQHKGSIDTRLRWLWNQKFGVVQTVWRDSKDVLDRTAATMILQCIMAQDLQSIEMLFQRIEGGAVTDDQVMEQQTQMRL
jgi:hypothetical protein